MSSLAFWSIVERLWPTVSSIAVLLWVQRRQLGWALIWIGVYIAANYATSLGTAFQLFVLDWTANLQASLMAGQYTASRNDALGQLNALFDPRCAAVDLAAVATGHAGNASVFGLA